MAFLAAGLGFLALAGLTLGLGWARGQARLLALALTAHGAWACSVSIATGAVWLVEPYLHFARALAWILFFASLTAAHAQPDGGLPRRAVVGVGILAAVFVVLSGFALAGFKAGWHLALALQLVAAVFVLALIAAVLRNSDEAARWHLKFLCFPLAGLFAYELFLDAQLLGLGVWSRDLVEVHGLLNLLAMPVIALGTLRARLWQRQVRISHRGALYSSALIASGVYLIVVAAVAVALGEVADAYRLPLQVAFLFLTVLALLIVLTSGAVRAGAKQFIARNFFARKYDYLHEWQRLLATLADDRSGAPLETRLIEAIANLVEAPGGALYTYDWDQGDTARPRLAGSWNFRPAATPVLAPTDFPTGTTSKEGAPAPQPLGGPALTDSAPDVWLAVPLVRGSRLVGFVALPRPRAGRTVDAEDRALIQMAAQHCAGQLAEQRLAQANAETRQFERFSRHYAFVVHDIKNIVSQLALLLKNFERHGHDPEFRADMTDTVANAVSRLEALTARIQGLKTGLAQEDLTETDLPSLLQERVRALNQDGSCPVELHVDPAAAAIRVRVPNARFTAVLDHLIANARETVAEAGGADRGPVRLELGKSGIVAVIDVVDRGCGMSPAFVASELFKPFRSTKADGLGMGAYQCRELARELGGDLEVLSTPDVGTTMRLSVPCMPPRERAAPADPPSNDDASLETAP